MTEEKKQHQRKAKDMPDNETEAKHEEVLEKNIKTAIQNRSTNTFDQVKKTEKVNDHTGHHSLKNDKQQQNQKKNNNPHQKNKNHNKKKKQAHPKELLLDHFYKEEKLQ